MKEGEKKKLRLMDINFVTEKMFIFKVSFPEKRKKYFLELLFWKKSVVLLAIFFFIDPN